MSQFTADANTTNWVVQYDDIEPIRIRDPIAEALCVLEPGDPFVITYEDVVKAAGHSCPTAAGSYRLAQRGLQALYPDGLPVRGDVEVVAGGPIDDPSYGVSSRLVSYVIGAAGKDGFGGLGGGFGGRQNQLTFGDIDADGVAYEFRRTDTDEVVRVTYHTHLIPDAGPATTHLPKLIKGTASAEERKAFGEAWHGRVRTVLTDDSLFTVETITSEE